MDQESVGGSGGVWSFERFVVRGLFSVVPAACGGAEWVTMRKCFEAYASADWREAGEDRGAASHGMHATG